MTKVFLKSSSQRSLRVGHPWIYRSQIKSVSEGAVAGGWAEVYSERKHFVGIGAWNPHSEITIRLLTRHKESVDLDFFKKRIQKAMDFRSRVVRDTNAWRVVSSEADELPGLIVDRYDEILVVQFLTLGMECTRPLIIDALREIVSPRGIYERSDSGSRKFEGLQERTGWIEQNCGSEVIVLEGDIQYRVRFGAGHKTGFYLDQRENRLLLGGLGVQGEVLDAFCYTGGFGLHLARSGCKVLGIDIQKDAITSAEENRTLNNLASEALEFKVGNAFDELKALEKEKRLFDLVVLDPPSFVKRKRALAGALSGYKEIVLRSMRLLKEGGVLAVFSCSYHVDDNLLMQTCLSAAWDVQKSIRVLKFLKQSGDHPIDPFIPETYYLKGFLFSVSAL